MGNTLTLLDFYNLSVQNDFPDVIVLHPDDFFLLNQRVIPTALGRDEFGPMITVFGMRFRPKIQRDIKVFKAVDLSKERLFSE